MQEHLVAMPVPLGGELADPGQHELLEMPRTAKQVQLSPNIIAKEEAVHQVAGGRKDAFVRIVVELTHPVGGGVEQFRPLIHVHQVVVYAEKIDQHMDERAPGSAAAIDVAGILQGGKHRRRRQPVGVGPGKIVQRGDIRAIRQRRFGGGMQNVEEDRRLRPVISASLILGREQDDFVLQQPSQFRLRPGPKMTIQQRPQFRVRLSKPETAAIGGVAGNDGANAFSMSHKSPPFLSGPEAQRDRKGPLCFTTARCVYRHRFSGHDFVLATRQLLWHITREIAIRPSSGNMVRVRGLAK